MTNIQREKKICQLKRRIRGLKQEMFTPFPIVINGEEVNAVIPASKERMHNICININQAQQRIANLKNFRNLNKPW